MSFCHATNAPFAVRLDPGLGGGDGGSEDGEAGGWFQPAPEYDYWSNIPWHETTLEEAMSHLIRSLKFAILEVLANAPRRKEHKLTLIGRSYQKGLLENRLGTTFDVDERELAEHAFNQVRFDSMIRPIYDDLAAPELWVEITDAGRRALDSRALDLTQA